MPHRLSFLVTLSLSLPLLAAGRAELDLFAGFTEDWRDAWIERSLAKRGNDFRLDEREGVRFLRVESDASATALWRPLALEMEASTTLSWRWRVAASLDHLDDERQKSQDDYAARIAVMFDGTPFGRTTPTVMYVWAGRQPVGSVYPSPYADDVATIVLRSGSPDDEAWAVEERNVREDFERVFGRPPERMTGVALMVDTDNTGSRATAWFADLVVGGAAMDPAGN